METLTMTPAEITQDNLDEILDVQYRKIIKFDISGEKFECTEETLLPIKNSLLGRVLFEDPILRKTPKGYFSFDRNGKYFSYILDFLRTKTKSWPPVTEIEKKVKQEFEFFGVPMDLFGPLK